ncbi:pyridoxal phosphate-dependent transferase [Dipodascopsis uninucleata]
MSKISISSSELSAQVVNTVKALPFIPIIVYNDALKSTVVRIARDAVFIYWTYRLGLKTFYEIRARGPIRATQDAYNYISKQFFRLLLKSPLMKDKVDAEVSQAIAKLEDSMIPKNMTRYLRLPEKGWDDEKVLTTIEEFSKMEHSAWEDGRVSGAVYHGGEDILELQTKAYHMFSVANQLHPDVFPGIRKMESEVVSIVLRLYNAPESAVGTTTSGGTESLLMTCLAAKMKARMERWVTEPEIIAPTTIHAGIDKACYYFGIKLRHVDTDPVTLQVDLAKVRRAINRNTILLVGSAPNFPHGVIDDIGGLSKIAVKYNIPLHVDACLGSFVTPFLEKVYAEIDPTIKVPVVDFRLPGVTSISCDTHKYGFAPKGSSIIMYRSASLRRYQYFLATDWTGGVYASPTTAGSRPGALIAGCWASLMRLGEDGYYSSARDIVLAASKLKAAIEDMDDLFVLGNPIASVVAFSSDNLNIYDIADAMVSRGWHLSALQKPAALHMAFTRLSSKSVDQLILDLREAVADIKAKFVAENEIGSVSNTKKGKGDTAMLYGVAGSISTAGVVDELAIGFLDCLYKT